MYNLAIIISKGQKAKGESRRQFSQLMGRGGGGMVKSRNRI